MAYDSKTYGQSPFGNSGKPESAENLEEMADSKPPLADGLDQGPKITASTETSGARSPDLASSFPTIPTIKPSATATETASDTRKSTRRKSRSLSGKTTSSPAANKGKARKSQKTPAAAAQADVEAVEQAVTRRFFEEDKRAYLSLLYKTGVSGLIWAVLRLLRYELSEKAIATINALIDPLMIATVALISVIALTFWTRRLLNDLARHTQQLHADAEMPDGKNYRPTLEIVGDSLEYNPKLRKNFAALFNAASILICSLISYLVTFALFPTG
ncbi:MAG: hypothetical protein WA885_19335 [Phormidesmis sp.]